MALVNVKPLDGARGYLRWKESMLLRLHTVAVAHVLFEDPPATEEGSPAAKQWARDDAVCRGHILAALSDRLLPDYVRHTTAREAWQAVARTYDLVTHMTVQSGRKFYYLEFDEGAPILEQIAHAEALAAKSKFPISDEDMAFAILKKLPPNYGDKIMARSGVEISMSMVWDAARIMEIIHMERQFLDQYEREGLL